MFQVMQHEFLGPVRLSEWGPPMSSTVYLVMSRSGDRFGIAYAGDCREASGADYFTGSDGFKCWLRSCGREEDMYLAILPMEGASDAERARVVGRIVSAYRPPCNG